MNDINLRHIAIDERIKVAVKAGSGTVKCSASLDDASIPYLLEQLKSHPTITKLDLSDNRIGAEGAKTLATTTNITHLNLADNNIGDEGAKALAPNTTITHLNLANNQITDAGTAELAANNTITDLDLSRNLWITSKTAWNFKDNTTLTDLNIDHENIGNLMKGVLKTQLARNIQNVRGYRIG